jgi:hypothetical protein
VAEAAVEAEKPKKERSPSYPFISLKKAVERVEALYANHKSQAARLVAVAPTWGYGVKSSGLLQTVATLKQFGLIEDLGSGEDRKIQISDLGRRIIADTRPGAREKALKEAAASPKLIAEYLPQWLPERPTDAHCISELHLDRGFTSDAARTFLRIFDETVAFAGLADGDAHHEEAADADSGGEHAQAKSVENPYEEKNPVMRELFARPGPKPFSERVEITTKGKTVAGTFTLLSSKEVGTLIKMLEANRAMLETLEEAADGNAS